MQSTKKMILLAALMLALSLLTPAGLCADEAPKVIPPVPLTVVAVKSVDAVEHFVNQLGMELPPFFGPASIASSLSTSVRSRLRFARSLRPTPNRRRSPCG